MDDKNDYLIFLRRANFDEYQPQNPRFKKVLADWQWYSLSEQLFFPWQLYRHKIDLMHFTHFNAPLFYRRPLVLTIHDLILQRWPTYKNNFLSRVKYFFKNLGYKIIIRSALTRAQKIIAVSRFVRDDIVKSFGVTPEKVAVIYEGSSSAVIASPDEKSGRSNSADSGNISGSLRRPAPRDDESLLAKHKIKKPYLLYVGNAYPHKNLTRLIETFNFLVEGGRNDLQLVLAGEEDYFYRQLKEFYNSIILRSMIELSEKRRVIFTGFVPDEELGALYRSAAVYIFPSLCEGFGLPPLEAMSYGVPVVSSGDTCLPEILGQAAHYFDSQNSADMAAKISEVLSSEALRQQLIAAGFEQIKKYSWQRMAEETARMYKFVD